MNRRTRTNIKVIFVAFLLAVAIGAGGLLLISFTTETGQVENQNSTSVPFARLESRDTGEAAPVINLDGSWTFTTDKGGVFDATVSNKTITIVMKAPNGTSMVYWYGTFQTYESIGSEITSNVLDDKAVLSQSTTKKFTVGSSTLSFSFTMQGITKTVDLHRV